MKPERGAGEDAEAAGTEPTEGEIATEQAMTAQAVVRAIEEAEKKHGHAPAGFGRIAAMAKRPAINPRTLLERYVKKHTSRSDYSYRKLRRSGMYAGMALPGLRSEQIGDLVVAIDTSGSVTDREIGQYAKDIEAVAKVMKPKSIRVIYCDAAVSGEQTFKKGQRVKLEPKGGGGTRFIPVFRHIRDNKIQSDLVLYLTDGYAENRIPGNLKPDAPVVWLVYDGDKRFSPNIGDVVHVSVSN